MQTVAAGALALGLLVPCVSVHAQPPPQVVSPLALGDRLPAPPPESPTPVSVPSADDLEPGQEPPPPRQGLQDVHALVRKGDLRAAKKLCETLLHQTPGDDELATQHARLVFWLGSPGTALREVEPVLRRHPEDTDVLELVAQLRLVEGDKQGALQAYQQLESVGVVKTELHQRILDLLMELGRYEEAHAALRLGGHLTDEQVMAMERARRRWQAEAGLAWLLTGTRNWPRWNLALSRRFGEAGTVGLLGVNVEPRDFATDYTIRGEVYGGAGPISWMAHASGSPQHTFLPVYDLRGDVSVQLGKVLAPGVWVRWAQYSDIGVLTLSPNLSLTLDAWTLTPGWMFVVQMPGALVHTGFFKVRWERHVRQAWFLWLYAGQDTSILNRFPGEPSGGLTAMLGFEHWFTGRWGMRTSLSRTEPWSTQAESWTEALLTLRGRF